MKQIKIFCYLTFLCFVSSGIVSGAEPRITSNRVEFKKFEEKVIFTGNVKMVFGNKILTADNAVKDDKLKIVDLSGNVQGYYVTDNTDTVKINTESGKLDINTNEMFFWGNAYTVYTSSSGKQINIKSSRVFLDDARKAIKFYENVTMSFEKSTAEAQQAEFLQNENKMYFFTVNGIRPVVNYANGYLGNFTADTITLFQDERKLIFENNVISKITKNTNREVK
ncbi:MAG: hypothetical protein A2252_00555 [Elusimicrobia bacterium RIFOXYA2_FULL_39_19]|nr:MAG: hypothetical protein A2252_00555 [Elusimicrobia bacterium RIFOXYA2_FULL_39_19]